MGEVPNTIFTWLVGLSVAAVVALGIAAYGAFKKRGLVQGEGESLPWRKNVLAALFMAYFSLLAVFMLMLANGVQASDAFDAINVPFVALVGGTLAIVKDLV